MNKQKTIAKWKSVLLAMRWKNLLILSAAMLFVQYFIIRPPLQVIGVETSLSFAFLFIVILAVLCIAAAGNIINTQFDRQIDAAANSEKETIHTHYSEDQILRWYIGLTLVGIGLGALAGWKVGYIEVISFYVFAAVSLWLYASFFSRYKMIGNVLIAGLTALPLFLLLVYERKLFMGEQTHIQVAYIVLTTIVGYGIFAFLSNWIREIIKDMEDKRADEMYGRKSIPIQWGMVGAKVSVFLLMLFFLALLGYVQSIYYQSNEWFPVVYIGICIQLPSFLLCIYMVRATSEQHFYIASTSMKAIMLLGLLSIPLFYFF